jgi:uncharacterized membrane protein
MDLARVFRHLTMPAWRVRRAFPPRVMDAVAAAIRAAEAHHDGEIRFAVEEALHPAALLRGQTPRQRAVEVFAQLRVWDTEHNNGVLLYVLFADRAVEIVCDRGVQSRAGAEPWHSVCRQIEAAFQHSQFEAGAVAGIEALAATLRRHYPADRRARNELPDQPLLL